MAPLLLISEEVQLFQRWFFMKQNGLLIKFDSLKENFQNFFAKKKTQVIKIEENKTDHCIDDLQLTINRDPDPHVNFSNNRILYLDSYE
jgi:hypothetical protein